MKKNIYLSLLFSISILISYSQDDYYSNHLESESAVPIPLSPEATSLGRYGNLPLNSSTGQMSFNVPLYEISTPAGSWPIFLQYGYNGLLLEGKPSIVGLGWTLPINGAVIRVIRGLPDEDQNGYYSNNGIVKGLIDNFINYGIDTLTINNIRDFKRGVYDSEVDKYNVNVAGLNFSFKIDENDNPIYLSKHSHLVTAITRSQTDSDLIDAFSVIDDQGVKYDFSETEKSIPNMDEELLLNARTAWNLTKITYINGQHIDFTYQPDTFTSYNFSASGTVQYGNTTETIVNAPIFYAPTYGERSIEGTVERKLLTKISFPGGSIDLNIIEIDGRKLYNSIQVKNPTGVINDYQFTYSGNRDALTYVTRNGLDYYRFEYHGVDDIVDVPAFMNDLNDRPLAQDSWKYYNGAGGNNSLISIPNSTYVADKEPNFGMTRLGAMKKIIYPTKGYTLVTYEQNQVRTDNIIGSDYYENLEMESEEWIVRLEGNYGEYGLPQEKVAIRGFTFDYPTVMNLRHSVTINASSSDIHMEIARFDKFTQSYTDCPYGEYYPPPPGFSLPSPVNTEASFYYNYDQSLSDAITQYNSGNPNSHLNPNTPYICPEYFYDHGPLDPVPSTTRSASNLVVLPGKYIFKIWTNFAGTTDAVAEIGVRLQKDWDQPPPTSSNVDLGGIRVASLQDFTSEQEVKPSTIRTFNYNDGDGFSTGKLTVIPLEKEVHTYRHTLLDGTITYREIHIYSSNPYTALNPSHGTPIYYDVVKEFNNQNNGYIQREYYPPIEDNSYNYPKRPVGVDLTKGRVKSEEVFKRKSIGDLELVSKSDHKFQQVRGLYSPNSNADENLNHPWSFKMVKKKDLDINFLQNSYPLNPATQAEIDAIKNLFTSVGYKELDSWFKKTSETKTSLFEGDSIIQKTDYLYNSHQNISSQKTTESNGDILERQLKYPYDIDETIYNSMSLEQNNQIAQPVEVTVLKNNSLLSQRKTEFKPGVFGYFPHVINTSKGNDELEPRIRFYFDADGNIIERQKLTDSTGVNYISTSYIWGYDNKYPIAKVENASRSVVFSNASLSGYLDQLDNYTAIDDSNREVFRLLNENIRGSLPDDVMITTYTYDPLIGVTSITDPRGYTTYYEYDEFNRLKQVKDGDGKILSKNEYHYKNQE